MLSPSPARACGAEACRWALHFGDLRLPLQEREDLLLGQLVPQPVAALPLLEVCAQPRPLGAPCLYLLLDPPVNVFFGGLESLHVPDVLDQQGPAGGALRRRPRRRPQLLALLGVDRHAHLAVTLVVIRN